MRRAKSLAAISVVVASLAATDGLSQSPKTGQRHPDFTLADIATGKPASLSDFAGKKVLLIQFASW